MYQVQSIDSLFHSLTPSRFLPLSPSPLLLSSFSPCRLLLVCYLCSLWLLKLPRCCCCCCRSHCCCCSWNIYDVRWTIPLFVTPWDGASTHAQMLPGNALKTGVYLLEYQAKPQPSFKNSRSNHIELYPKLFSINQFGCTFLRRNDEKDFPWP